MHLFDLNAHGLAADKRATFDLVVNFGTTEHLMNQFNAFKVMHEATKPGGYMFHQVPSTGWINHGYFCYNALMFEELAQANGYEILDLWFYGSMSPETVLVNAAKFPGVMDASKLHNNVEGLQNSPVASANINVLLRKVHDARFRVGLEVKTAAGGLDRNASYTSEYIATTKEDQFAKTKDQLVRTEDQLVKANGPIAWMKSKYWKTRDSCVRFKRSLGALTGRGATG